jgi:hypothetical protein
MVTRHCALRRSLRRRARLRHFWPHAVHAVACEIEVKVILVVCVPEGKAPRDSVRRPRRGADAWSVLCNIRLSESARQMETT